MIWCHTVTGFPYSSHHFWMLRCNFICHDVNYDCFQYTLCQQQAVITKAWPEGCQWWVILLVTEALPLWVWENSQAGACNATTDLKLRCERVFNISVNFEIRNKQQFFQLWVAWAHFVRNPVPFFHIRIITNWRSGTLYPNTSETTPTWINSNSWQKLVQTTFSPWFFFPPPILLFVLFFFFTVLFVLIVLHPFNMIVWSIWVSKQCCINKMHCYY